MVSMSEFGLDAQLFELFWRELWELKAFVKVGMMNLRSYLRHRPHWKEMALGFARVPYRQFGEGMDLQSCLLKRYRGPVYER